MIRRTALIALALLSLTGCVNRAAQQQAKVTQKIVTDPTVPVKVQPAKTMDLNETLEVTGAFATSEQSGVGPAVAGRLVAVYVRDGDAIRAGQPIAQQETQDLMSRLRQAQAQVSSAQAALQQALSDARVAPTKSESNVKAAQARLSQAQARYNKAKNGSRSEERTQAEWNVKRAQSDLETARTALERARRLFSEGAVAKVEVESAENRYDNAMAAYQGALQNQSIVLSATRPEDLQAALDDVRAAQEALRVAQADKQLDVVYSQRVSGARANLQSAQDQVSLARKALSDATIRAPFSGRVSGKPVQVGTFVAPGTTVATIVGASGTYFEANVPESQVARVQPGTPVQVTIDALNGLKATGSVLAVNPVASGQGRVYTVRVSVNESLGVKPGMFARGQIKLGERPNATVVPADAVIRDGENAYVFTVAGDKAKRVNVKLGLTNDGVVEVDGLEPGASVVIAGQSTLVDGTKVKVEETKTGA